MAVIQDNISTRTILLTSAGVNIIAHMPCRRIRVQEDYTSAVGATTDLGMTAPVGGGQVIVLKGTPAVFTASGPNGAFTPGQIVGIVATLDVAEVEGQQIEDQII